MAARVYEPGTSTSAAASPCEPQDGAACALRRGGFANGCRHPAGRSFKLSCCRATAERRLDWLRTSGREYFEGGRDVHQRGAARLVVGL